MKLLGKSYFIRLLMPILVGIGPMLFTACARDYVTGRSSYNWFQVKDDVKLGNQVLGAQVQALESKNVPYDESHDEVMLERLQTIVKRLSKVSHLPDLPYEVHLADSKVVNAWCAPGGKIMVFSGLYDEKKGLVRKASDDEIAAVLAHEMAHATARHVTESISQSMTIQMAGTAVGGAIAAGGSTVGSNLFGQFFSTGYNLYAPSYSRKNEREADVLGLFYMAKAGYDPRAAVEVWTRAAQKSKGAESFSIFASHPSSGERAKRLQAYLPEAIAIYENPSLPYPDFSKKLKTDKALKTTKTSATKTSETKPSKP